MANPADGEPKDRSNAPRTLPDPPDNVSHDLYVPGIDKKTHQRIPIDNSRLPEKTDVFYVNGINSTEAESMLEAQRYAQLTHKEVRVVHDHTDGQLADVFTATREALRQARGSFAIDPAIGKVNDKDFPVEQLLATEIFNSVDRGQKVHIGAYSRGAVITENAIKIVDQTLTRQGLNEDQVVKWHEKNLSLETFNGFSHTVAPGIPAVHYVNRGDYAVGELTGMGSSATFLRNFVVDPNVMLVANHLDVPAAQTEFAHYLKAEGFFNHPNGPVIDVPPVSIDPIKNHGVFTIFDADTSHAGGYRPYSQARDAFAEFQLLQQSLQRDAPAVPTGPSTPAPSLHPDTGNTLATDAGTRPHGGPDTPQYRPGDAPIPVLVAHKNGVELHLTNGSHEDGKLHRSGGMIIMTSRDTAGHPTSLSVPEGLLTANMSRDEVTAFKKAVSENATIHLDFKVEHDKLTPHVTVDRPLQLAHTHDRSPARTRSSHGVSISD